MHGLFVGVDAGGSHTIAALCSRYECVRTVAGPGANPNLIGIEAAAQSIERTVERVLEGESPDAIGIGVAGAGEERIAARLRASLSRSFPGACIALCHDARIALRAAIPEGDGLVLIAGTGSIAYAEIGEATLSAPEATAICLEIGSAYAIGAAALRQLLAAMERGRWKTQCSPSWRTTSARTTIGSRRSYLSKRDAGRRYRGVRAVGSALCCRRRGVFDRHRAGCRPKPLRVDCSHNVAVPGASAAGCLFGRAVTRTQRYSRERSSSGLPLRRSMCAFSPPESNRHGRAS